MLDILLLPTPLEYAIVFIFGVIIGSFLNVFIYRFHTGRSINGSSHCLSCGNKLKPYELFPLLSYLFLRGTCRNCGSYIPSRYFLVELLTGILFTLTFLTSTSTTDFLFGITFISVLVVVAVYDLYHFIIPDELTVTLVAIAFAVSGFNLFFTTDALGYFWSLGVALLGSLFFFGLWHFSRGRSIGFGDVKLVFPLGLMVGSGSVFSMIVLSFWVGAVVGMLLLGFEWLKRRGQPHLRLLPQRLTMKSAVPFAPFLIIGFLLVYLFQIDVITLLTYGY